MYNHFSKNGRGIVSRLKEFKSLYLFYTLQPERERLKGLSTRVSITCYPVRVVIKMSPRVKSCETYR